MILTKERVHLYLPIPKGYFIYLETQLVEINPYYVSKKDVMGLYLDKLLTTGRKADIQYYHKKGNYCLEVVLGTEQVVHAGKVGINAAGLKLFVDYIDAQVRKELRDAFRMKMDNSSSAQVIRDFLGLYQEFDGLYKYEGMKKYLQRCA